MGLDPSIWSDNLACGDYEGSVFHISNFYSTYVIYMDRTYLNNGSTYNDKTLFFDRGTGAWVTGRYGASGTGAGTYPKCEGQNVQAIKAAGNGF